MDAMQETADRLALLSRWIDDHPENAARDAEANLWCRVGKISEENGEAIAALIGVTGQNPRKGVTHTMGDLRKELLDVAVTALCAIEHTGGNQGRAMEALAKHVAMLIERADLCAVCGRDNRNETHDALQLTGHLNHDFQAVATGVAGEVQA